MEEDLEFRKKLNYSIFNLKKIFNYYFEYHFDFEKKDEEIANEVINDVKKHVSSMLLLNQYVNFLLDETYKKYFLKDDKKNKVYELNELLSCVYSDIISCCYYHLYPNWLI